MYEELRLTELHEEIAFATEQARRHELADRPDQKRLWNEKRQEVDAEIRRRVAALLVVGPGGARAAHRFPQLPLVREGVALKHGTPDALREYPRRSVSMFSGAPFDSWVNHAAHFLPVASCHLCREGR
jgi:hypothetical protein